LIGLENSTKLDIKDRQNKSYTIGLHILIIYKPYMVQYRVYVSGAKITGYEGIKVG